MKINFFHLENVFKVPFKQILFTLKIYFQRTLFSGEACENVNKCIFSGRKLYYFCTLGSRPENTLRIAQMELRSGSADFMRFCGDLNFNISDAQKKPVIYDK